MDHLTELLSKIFDQLMLTGKEALPHMVKAYQAHLYGIVGLCIFFLAAGMIGLSFAGWQAKRCDDLSDGESGFAVGVGVVSGIVSLVSVVSLVSWGPDLVSAIVDPMGAYINHLLPGGR